MNIYLEIAALVAQLIGQHSSNGQAVPSPVTNTLNAVIKVLTAIEGAKTGFVSPTNLATAIQDLETAIAALAAAGVSIPVEVGGHTIDPVAEIQKFAATKANFESGQAAFIGSFPYSNAAANLHNAVGDIWFTLKGGPGEQGLIGTPSPAPASG